MARTDQKVQQAWGVFNQWVLMEIMKYRARFVRVCYIAILPKAVYEKAKDNKDMKACKQWANDNGWRFQQKGESLLLLKEGKVLGEFRPVMCGGKDDPHLEFYAMLAGQRLELVLPGESDETKLRDLFSNN